MVIAECSPAAAKGLSDFVSGLFLKGGGDSSLTYLTISLIT